MLDKKTFTVGVGKIVAIINKKYNNTDNSFFEVLYMELSDLNNDFFVEGIDLLLKSENIVFFPSVKQIRDYVFKVQYNGYSVEELIDLANVRKLTNQPLSNKYLDNIISNINIESSMKENTLVFKGNNYAQLQ